MKRDLAPIPILDRLAALGDMVRLRTMRLLESESLSVGEVARVLQLPQSTMSRHLKVLADAGWVSRRNEGTATFYSLIHDDLSPKDRILWTTIRAEAGDSAEFAEDQRRLKGVLADRRTDSVAFFGRYAGEWDALRAGLFGANFTSLSLLSLIRPDWVVADLGCGTGNASELLAPVVEKVYAVDQSGPMLAAAQSRLASLKNVAFVEASAEQTTLPAASIDIAVAALVLHHLPDPARFASEARRILRTTRQAGHLLLVDMVEHEREEYRQTMGHQHLGFSRPRIESLMSDAGFSSVSYRELTPEPNAKGPGLFVAVAKV